MYGMFPLISSSAEFWLVLMMMMIMMMLVPSRLPYKKALDYEIARKYGREGGMIKEIPFHLYPRYW